MNIGVIANTLQVQAESHDTREALYMRDLSDDIKAEMEKGDQGRETPELDHLME
jgi:hypothetical protein